MKSASQMSLEIRRKKKSMQEDPDTVDLSGIPMDKQDEDLMEASEMTTEDGLDTNHPKQRNEQPTAHQELMEDSHDRAHERKAPDSDRVQMFAEGGSVLPKYMHPPKNPKMEAVGTGRTAMAHGGQMEDDPEETTVRPDKGWGSVTVIDEKPKEMDMLAEGGLVDEHKAEHGEGEHDMKAKRLARLAKKMSR